MGLSGGMEVEDEEKKKKVNEDVMVFLRKQSETHSPRYASRLKNLVNLQQKRRRAAAARRHSDQQIMKTEKAGKPKNTESKTLDSTARASKEEVGKRHGRAEKSDKKSVRSRSHEPSDRCGRRRRRSSCRRKRRRCRRSRSRRRRRRSCCRRRKRCCRRRRRRRRRC